MKFIPAIQSFYKRSFDFEGRSSRSEYWWVLLFHLVIYCTLIISIFSSSFTIASPAQGQTTNIAETTQIPAALFVVLIILAILLTLASIIPMIALTVRRFHDQNRTGWLSLTLFIPYIGSLILFIFMCLKGTRGANKFGDDPLETIKDIFG